MKGLLNHIAQAPELIGTTVPIEDSRELVRYTLFNSQLLTSQLIKLSTSKLLRK
ncbi:MAG: hypothetical protein ACK5SL_01345 [Cyclobacteriaceae bacterium]